MNFVDDLYVGLYNNIDNFFVNILQDDKVLDGNCNRPAKDVRHVFIDVGKVNICRLSNVEAFVTVNDDNGINRKDEENTLVTNYLRSFHRNDDVQDDGVVCN